MKLMAAAVGWMRVGAWLAASGAWGLAGCGGGGGDPSSEDVQAMASTAVGGQPMPLSLGMQTTQRSLDVAIDGGGAFVLVDPSNGTLVLSRRGHFDIDSRGRIVNDEGWLVAGVSAGAVPSSLADLKPLPAVTAMLPLPPVVIDIPAQRYPSGYSTSAIAGVKVDLSGMTSYGAIFGVTDASQDGSPPGTLNYATIKATGELDAHYSDGRVDRSRRLALARVTVADRLHSYGVSGWLCGRGCQSPVVALPGQMLTGMLVPGALNAVN